MTEAPAAINGDGIPGARHCLVVRKIAQAALSTHQHGSQDHEGARGVNASVPERHAGQLLRATGACGGVIRLLVGHEADSVWTDERAFAARQHGNCGRLAGAQAVLVYLSVDRIVARGHCYGTRCALPHTWIRWPGAEARRTWYRRRGFRSVGASELVTDG